MWTLSQVNEAEEERLRSEREHMRVTHACQEAEARVQMLQKSLKRAIVKSKPYFELKAQFNQILEVKPDSVFTSTAWLTCLLLRTSHSITESTHIKKTASLCHKCLFKTVVLF